MQQRDMGKHPIPNLLSCTIGTLGHSTTKGTDHCQCATPSFSQISMKFESRLRLNASSENVQALAACSRGYNFFKDCNLLLHVQTTKNFFQREFTVDYFVGIGNMIRSHEEWKRNQEAPHGQEEWHVFLTHINGEFIQWKLSWMSGRSIVRGPEKYIVSG